MVIFLAFRNGQAWFSIFSISGLHFNDLCVSSLGLYTRQQSVFYIYRARPTFTIVTSCAKFVCVRDGSNYVRRSFIHVRVDSIFDKMVFDPSKVHMCHSFTNEYVECRFSVEEEWFCILQNQLMVLMCP